MDQWAGYEVGRKRLLQFMTDHKVSNPVVLTGDIHTNWINDLKINFDNGRYRIRGNVHHIRRRRRRKTQRHRRRSC